MPRRALPHELRLELGLDEPQDLASLKKKAARALGCSPEELPELKLLSRSLDARRGSVRFSLLVGFEGSSEAAPSAPPREVSQPARVIIVGDGPAGLLCAYQLARRGVASVVLDRGKPVQPRRHDLKALNKSGTVDTDSNYCFGEGGAGTYSDGKLYTRAHKRGSVRDVLEILAEHGAKPEILLDARPHIGSNRLPKVVSALRQHLESVGVAFRFGARVVGLLTVERNARREVRGVRLSDDSELEADAVVLATGHSARDVFDLLCELGVRLEAKPFAVGVRIEHPQPLINRIQYGKAARHPKLPAASYRAAANVEGRGVFSFCMCPGGFVVPAATSPGELVVNGMSLSKRDSPFANSGIVVSVEPRELAAPNGQDALLGVDLQRTLERAAAQAGGGALRAPATRLTDFLAGRASSSVPRASYLPGITPANVAEILDSASLQLSSALRAGLAEFGKKLRGYVTEEAVLIGVETRTSSPVRVPRDPDSLCAVDLAGLYPAGEGAGFAGGIVSAALDGMRVAESVARRLRS